MDSYLEFEVLPEVDDVLKLQVSGASEGFSGVADCYVSESNFQVFCSSLEGFPKNLDQTIQFDSDEAGRLSSFKLSVSCLNSSGHIQLKVRIDNVSSFINLPKQRFFAEFSLIAEPAEMDRFQNSLKSVSNAENVGSKARLNGKT